MNALQKTLAMIAFLILVSQTIRHSYRLWVEPRGSVLDKYDRALKNEITQASTLDELVQRYEPLRKKADAAREELAKQGKTFSYVENLEPFKSEHELHEAIKDWEAKAGEVRSLRVYWIVGLVLFVLACLPTAAPVGGSVWPCSLRRLGSLSIGRARRYLDQIPANLTACS